MRCIRVTLPENAVVWQFTDAFVVWDERDVTTIRGEPGLDAIANDIVMTIEYELLK